MPLPSSTDAFQTQTILTKSLVLSNGSDGRILLMPCHKDTKSMSLFSQQQATSSLGDGRLETQQTPTPQHMDKVLNDTLDDETVTMIG